MGADADASSKLEDLQKWEGPAFASIVAVLLGLSFQRLTEVFDGALYWFIATVFCSLYVDPRLYRSWRERFLYCGLPAAWLVAAWAIPPALGIVWGGFQPSAGEKELFLKLLIAGPIAFGLTTLAIPLWALAKRPILEIFVDPGRLANIAKSLQGIGLIISLVLTGVLYMKGIGSNH